MLDMWLWKDASKPATAIARLRNAAQCGATPVPLRRGFRRRRLKPARSGEKRREAGLPVRRSDTPTTLASGNGTRKQAGQRIDTGFVETVRGCGMGTTPVSMTRRTMRHRNPSSPACLL